MGFPATHRLVGRVPLRDETDERGVAESGGQQDAQDIGRHDVQPGEGSRDGPAHHGHHPKLVSDDRHGGKFRERRTAGFGERHRSHHGRQRGDDVHGVADFHPRLPSEHGRPVADSHRGGRAAAFLAETDTQKLGRIHHRVRTAVHRIGVPAAAHAQNQREPRIAEIPAQLHRPRLRVVPHIPAYRHVPDGDYPVVVGHDGVDAGDVRQRMDRLRHRRLHGAGRKHRDHHHGQSGGDGGQHGGQTGGVRPFPFQHVRRVLGDGPVPAVPEGRGGVERGAGHWRPVHGHPVCPSGPVAVPHVLQCGQRAHPNLVHEKPRPYCDPHRQAQGIRRGRVHLEAYQDRSAVHSGGLPFPSETGNRAVRPKHAGHVPPSGGMPAHAVAGV